MFSTAILVLGSGFLEFDDSTNPIRVGMYDV